MLTEAKIRIKTAALRHFCPNGFTTSEDMDTFHCVSESTPSKSDVDAKVVELTAEYDAQAYARNRASAYDSIGNQLDLLFHDMTASKGSKSGEWYKAIAKVKADNPKG